MPSAAFAMVALSSSICFWISARSASDASTALASRFRISRSARFRSEPSIFLRILAPWISSETVTFTKAGAAE